MYIYIYIYIDWNLLVFFFIFYFLILSILINTHTKGERGEGFKETDNGVYPKIIARNIIVQLTSPNGFNGDIQGLRPSPFNYKYKNQKNAKEKLNGNFIQNQLYIILVLPRNHVKIISFLQQMGKEDSHANTCITTRTHTNIFIYIYIYFFFHTNIYVPMQNKILS